MDVEFHTDVDRYMGVALCRLWLWSPIGLVEERSERPHFGCLVDRAGRRGPRVLGRGAGRDRFAGRRRGRARVRGARRTDRCAVRHRDVDPRRGGEIEVRSVARSTTYDAYALIARRASGHRYGLATKERPHRTVAWLRNRDSRPSMPRPCRGVDT